MILILLILICPSIFCRSQINVNLAKNFGFDEWDTPIRYTAEQLRPQEFDENPFQYSGYFNVDEKNGGNMFYIFFPSKDGNKDAPVIVWLQGGPGCSSLIGLFVELGPYKVDKTTLKIEENPYTWNNHYHMIFIDQPIGTGWSYFEKDPEYITTEEEVGDMLFIFFQKFFADSRYSQYQKNDLYIFGESYAGKYIPAIGQKLLNEKLKGVNLKGIGIGDGLTHPLEQFSKYDIYGIANSLFGYHDLDYVVKMQNETIDLIKSEKYVEANNKWNVVCDYIEKASGGVNQYDIRTHTQYDFSEVTNYANLNTTKQLMNIKNLSMTYSSCSSKVYTALIPDICKSIRQNVINILDSNEFEVKVLIYNAQFDMLISVPGSINGWVYDMPWKHKKEFRDAKREVWKLDDGSFAGWKKKFEKLHTVVVGDAGHMSPVNEPQRSLDMVTKFIEGKL